MIRHFLLLAGRRFRRDSGFSVVNVLGLAAGLAASFVLLDVIYQETSYDQFPGSDRTYRIAYETTFGGVENTNARGPSALFPALEESIPLIESAAAFIGLEDVLVERPHGVIELGKAYFATGDVFGLFPRSAVQGSLESALANPGSIVLSRETAQRLFSSADVVGEVIRLDTGESYTVTAVLESGPPTHLMFDALVYMPPGLLKVWNGFVALIYVRLSPGASPESFRTSTIKYVRENAPGGWGEMLNPFLQGIEEIHLASRLEDEAGRNGSARSVWILALAAALTLLMAVSNYVNLASLRISRRIGEVGVRKAIGATRTQVWVQFMFESLLLAAVAVPFALILYLILRSFVFPDIAEGTSEGLSALAIVSLSVGVAGLVGLLAGAYPSFLLAVTSPQTALRGGGTPRQGLYVRRLLMGFQFMVTLSFLLTATVVALQIRFIASKDLGYTPEQVVFSRIWEDVAPAQYETIAREIRLIPAVTGVSYGQLPGTQTGGYFAKGPDGRSLLINRYVIGPGYTEALGIDMALGSPLREEGPEGLLLNETAVRHLSLSEPIGTVLQVDGQDLPIVGVMRDFHFFSLHDPVPPVYAYSPSRIGPNLIVRVRGAIPGDLATQIADVWTKHGTGGPFYVESLSDHLGTDYREETQLNRLLLTFGIVAAVIAFMGLFTMVAYVISRRRKELAIRRVLGASRVSLTWIVGAESVIVFGLASTIALTLSVIVGRAWLDGFEFRIGFPFIAACLILSAVLIATALLSLYHVSSESSQSPAVALKEP